ncbi:conserved hypothetical protein [Neospora caninum Liverpool]|uniref:Sel1 repeat-containing protein n=1 Tax=Neospora caninum (strain Liverpool) TaxID=572307 RepID=F0VNH7_NEOCL|nr:conserved hypothetical protein [Neospora caninum Liverpool]CBZ55273.1 conserved hypothetical protein [Neospora caninum Liverpool]|eukprot:XP_003885301.1 conserved hypothetical protein [Neospora caninum Liverpool]
MKKRAVCGRRQFTAFSLSLLLLLSATQAGEALRRRETESAREDRQREDGGRLTPQEAGEALERLLPTLQAREQEAFLNVSPERMQMLQAAVERKYGENGQTSDGRQDAATAQALYELGDLQIRGKNPPTLPDPGRRYPGVLGRVTRDLHSAVRDFRAAALLGYGPALHALGVAYAVGLGPFEPNEAEAARLHYLASLTDYIPAVLATGFRFLHGDGVAADCETALRYYKFAAERAVQLLAPPPPEGEDSGGFVPPPPLGEGDRLTDQTIAQWRELQTVHTQQKEILQYWEQQAKDGNPMAQYELAKLREQQPPPSGSTDPGDINAEAERLRQVADLYKASGEQGLAPALRDLGLLYLQGHGVERNFPKAVECFKRAADLGDPESQNYLGYLYYFGASAPAPSEPARTAPRFASDPVQLKSDDPSSPLAVLSASPRGRQPETRSPSGSHPPSSSPPADDMFVIPRNESLALHYFTQAALKEYPEALFFLGEIEVQAYTAQEGTEEGRGRARDGKAGRRERDNADMHAADGEKRQREGTARRGRRTARAPQDDEARLAKALRLYQRAADGGYILAAWREGQLLEAGKGTPRSCEDAALAYKLVAEAGPWVDDIRRGIAQYVAGDLEGALLTYAFAAEEGYEVAQSNAAFLYSRFRPSWVSSPSLAPAKSPKRAPGPSSTRDGTAYPIERDEVGDSAGEKKRSFWRAFADLWGGDERATSREARTREEAQRNAETEAKTVDRRTTKQRLFQNPLQMEEPNTNEAYGPDTDSEGFAKAVPVNQEEGECVWGLRYQGKGEDGGQQQETNRSRRASGGREEGKERDQSAFVNSDDRRGSAWTEEIDHAESEEDSVPPRLPQIYRMWNRAALQGNPAALQEIAKFHINGSPDGVIVSSPELSVEVLKISLAHGDVKSLPVLASLYESGTSITPPLYGRAIDLLKFYAEAEQAHAAAGPQQALRSGVGTPWQGWREALQRRFRRWGLAARIGRLRVKEKFKRRAASGEKRPGKDGVSRAWWGKKYRD